MKRIILLAFVALMSLFGARAVTTMPVTSTDGNETWYLIKCNPRDASDRLKTWVTVDADDTLRYHTYTGGDEQLWKVVANGTGVALVNKKTNAYLNVDAALDRANELDRSTKLSVTTNTQSNALRLVPTTAYTITWEAPGWDATNGGVFIVDNTNTIVDDNFNITFNTTAKTRSFCMTALGGPSYALWNIYGWPGGNPNQAVLFRTPAEAVVDVKALLQDAITNANTLYNNSSMGPNPGQYAADDMTSLKDAIDAAQAVYDDPASSANNYSSSTTDLNFIVASFRSVLILPKVSDDFNEYWYFFQGTRPANTYMTSTGSGANVLNKAIIPDNTQLWKIVANGDGYAFVNKATEEYINTDVASNTSLVTQGLVPTKALKFRASPEMTNKVVRFYVENTGSTVDFRLHSGTANVMSWTGDATDNCSWLIMDYAAAKRETLRLNLADANTFAMGIQVGNNPGQVTQAVLDEFKAIVATQQAVYDDPDKTSDDYMTAATALADAKVALKTKANLPVISTDANTVWYTLTGTRPEVASVVYSNPNDSLKYRVLKQDDSEMWRFVANGTGFAIQNKATMKYVACDSVDGSQLITQTAMPVTPLKFVVTDQIAQGAFRFLMVNDAATQPWGDDLTFNFHAADASPMNYLDPTDHSGWLIADNAQTIRNAYSTLFASAKILYASTLYSFNLLSESAKTAMTNAVNTARADSANFNNMSYAQLQTAYQTFSDAVTAFNNSRINSLVSTAANPKWIFITGCNSAGPNGYNSRISNVNSELRGVAKNDTDSAQMWRFELNADNTTVRMINAKAPHDEASLTTKSVIGTLVASGSGTPFTFKTHGDGFSTAICSPTFAVHCDAYHQIVSWEGAAGNIANPNSAWRFDVVGSSTAVKNTTVNKYLIRSVNGVITIDGVSNFEVYSIMGQRMNNKATLRKGVYIVKVGNEAQKYIVR